MTDDRNDPPDPIPPEVIEEALRNFNEADLLREIREADARGWFKLEDFIGELEAIARRADGQPSREV